MRRARKWTRIEVIEDCVYVDGVLFGRGSVRVWGTKNPRIRIVRYENDYGQRSL